MPLATPLRSIALLVLSLAATSFAQAQATITHDKALAGGVTPGDTAGYPVTITQPGSYKLMSNLYVPAGSKGISVQTAGVSLDLNGFTIQGPGSCTRNAGTKQVSCTGTGGLGVYSEADTSFMQVRNGTIQGFNHGVVMNGGRAEGLILRHNNSGLVNSAGGYSGAIIAGVVAQLNLIGVQAEHAQVQDSILIANNTGVRCDNGAVLNSQVLQNRFGLESCSMSKIHFASNGTDSTGSTGY